MEEKYVLTPRIKIITLILIGLGVLVMVWGFLTKPGQTWANFLVDNFYFLSITIGAGFFLSIQYIAQAGWSAAFKRIPEAIAAFLPIAAVLFLLMLLGLHFIYHWTLPGVTEHDELLQHKSPYLNVPFFTIRMVFYFALWIYMARLLRKFSLKEDLEGGMHYFNKSEFYSRINIFILAITFSFASFDWLMSIDPHWYSTIFAFKTFASAFLHGSAALILIILLLNRKGYFKFINGSHLHDFTRYIFILSIIYGYLWFAQFTLIWYGNIPEETVYFTIRFDPQWKFFFYLDIILNWAIPFLFLMPRSMSRNKTAILIVSAFVLLGQWVDIYLHVLPEVSEKSHIGLLELGIFLGYLGLFTLVVLNALSKVSLVPKNHPYLEESLNHHF